VRRFFFLVDVEGCLREEEIADGFAARKIGALAKEGALVEIEVVADA
jgi:hypothetical protein